MDGKFKLKVKRFCAAEARKGRSALYLLGPALAKRFRLTLKEGCQLAKEWAYYEL
jgi:hypothetical protein